MYLRATILCSCLLTTACGPGTGDTADTAATTGGASTSSGGSSTGAATGGSGTSADTTPTTGGMTGDTGATTAATTTNATSGTSTDATSGTTGAAACEDIVGSQDCEALVAVATELSFETCIQCQGVPCGKEPECDGEFPCVDDAIVIQGCCSDRQCAGLTPFCGMFIGTNNVCVNHDDV